MNKMAALVAVALLGGCGERSPENREARTCQKGGEVAATVTAQTFVERRLRSPSTADFPWGNQATWLGGCDFRVVSYVDAQNGFGATVRTPYMITVAYLPDDDAWRARDLVME